MLKAKLDKRVEEPARLNPYFVAFLQAHGRRCPVPFVAYPFTEWMHMMYDRYFEKVMMLDPLGTHWGLAWNLRVHEAQQHDFEQWLLAESKKDDCPRYQELMDAELVEEE